jgi:hypothetical protein
MLVLVALLKTFYFKGLFMKLLFLFITLILMSCSDDSKEFKENINIQAEENIKAKNEDIKDWAIQLEKDIEQRWNFIQSISDEFHGNYISNLKLPTDNLKNVRKFAVKFIISPNYQHYAPHRDRTVPELEKELSNLKVNVKVLHWLEGNEYTASGCSFKEIIPNFNDGLIELFDKDCGNTYQLLLQNPLEENISSNQIAKQLLENKVDFIFAVRMQNTAFAADNKFILEK